MKNRILGCALVAILLSPEVPDAVGNGLPESSVDPKDTTKPEVAEAAKTAAAEAPAGQPAAVKSNLVGVTATVPAPAYQAAKLSSIRNSIAAAVSALKAKLAGVKHGADEEIDTLTKELQSFNDHVNQATKTASYVAPSMPETLTPEQRDAAETARLSAATLADRTQVNPGQGAKVQGPQT